MAQYIVDTGPGTAPLRMRTKPSTSAGVVVAYHKNGARIEVDSVANGWAKLAQTVGGVSVTSGALSDGFVYADARYLVPVDVPKPPAQSQFLHARYQNGVNCLQFHHYAVRAMADGCRFVMLMDNGGGAQQLAQSYPDAIVMYRRYHSVKLPPQQMVDVLDITWSTLTKNLYITLSNESDTQNPNNLIEYFRWFIECAALIWKKNPSAVICFGTWGHGNPNWPDPSVERVWREVVAPWLNTNKGRVVVDLHTYTKGRRLPSHPPGDAPIIGMDWFELRYRFAYRFGLSVEIPHVSGEWGVEAGHGGFTWAGYTSEQFREWSIITINATRQTFTEAPMLGRALYHYGEHAGWKGYWMQQYYPELVRQWREDLPIVQVAL
jgi:hypothetical protein